MPVAYAQAYVSYSNTSGSRPRPAVIVVPDYDGIGNYERWRADLLASQGYVGALAALSRHSLVQATRITSNLGTPCSLKLSRALSCQGPPMRFA